jgi:hypothetical protein
VQINEANINHVPAANGDPCLPYPFDLDTPVDQDVKVRVPILLEFQDPNVLWGATVVTPKVNPKFVIRRIQVTDRIAFDL